MPSQYYMEVTLQQVRLYYQVSLPKDLDNYIQKNGWLLLIKMICNGYFFHYLLLSGVAILINPLKNNFLISSYTHPSSLKRLYYPIIMANGWPRIIIYKALDSPSALPEHCILENTIDSDKV